MQPSVPRIVSRSAYPTFRFSPPVEIVDLLSSSNCVFILRPFAPSTNCGGAAEYAAEIAQRSQSQRKNPYA
jgi:hypothetical protein